MKAWKQFATGFASLILAGVSAPAWATYTYTFSGAAIGTVSFSTPTLIAPNQYFSNYTITPIIGTETSGSFSQDLSFDLIGGKTSTGYSFDQYEFAFSSFPTGAGHFDASNAGNTFTFYSPASNPHSGVYTSGALDVAFVPNVAAVPESASWTMMIGGFGLIGGFLRRRQRLSLHLG